MKGVEIWFVTVVVVLVGGFLLHMDREIYPKEIEAAYEVCANAIRLALTRQNVYLGHPTTVVKGLEQYVELKETTEYGGKRLTVVTT